MTNRERIEAKLAGTKFFATFENGNVTISGQTQSLGGFNLFTTGLVGQVADLLDPSGNQNEN